MTRHAPATVTGMEMNPTHTVHHPAHVETFAPDPSRPGAFLCVADGTVIGDTLASDDLVDAMRDAAIGWHTVGSFCPTCALDAIFNGALPTARMEWHGGDSVSCDDCGTSLSGDDDWAFPADVDEALADELERSTHARRVVVGA